MSSDLMVIINKVCLWKWMLFEVNVCRKSLEPSFTRLEIRSLSLEFNINWGLRWQWRYKKSQHSNSQSGVSKIDWRDLNQKLILKTESSRFRSNILKTQLSVEIAWSYNWFKQKLKLELKMLIHLKFMESKFRIGLIRWRSNLFKS